MCLKVAKGNRNMIGSLRYNGYDSLLSNKMFFITLTVFLLMTTMIKESKTQPFYPDSNYIEEDKNSPGFLTSGQKFSIALGSTVVLPCKINETDKSAHYILAWKRDIAVLTAGNIKVTVNPRLRLLPSHESGRIQDKDKGTYNLEIRDVRITDGGGYACQIGTMEPKEIVHILEVLVPPTIDLLTPSTRLDVSKGASIRLECRAKGNPSPKLNWSRKNNVLPNGEPNVTSNILEMMHANRHTAGHYICTADNNVGRPDSKEVHVNVLYAPEIEIERAFIHTGVGYEAQLICIVHAEPQPHVIWYKDTTQLGTTEQHSQQIRGNRYSMIIRNVTNHDLGNYTCQASNNLGKDRATLTLSGIPATCVFDSPTLSDYRDLYNISWTVQSYATIREYRLFYKRQSSGASNVLRGSHSRIHNNHNIGYHDKNIENHILSHNNEPHEDEWENVILQVTTKQMSNIHSHTLQNSRQRMSYLIRNLSPATNYEARVHARNDHGWNKLSGIFHFSTRAEDLEMEPSAQPAVLKTAEIIDKDLTSATQSTIKVSCKFFIITILLGTITTIQLHFS